MGKMTDGQQFLAEYAETQSEAAFRELVTRYVDLVYSAAVRLVNGDIHLAEDVTQTVFVDLARMARSLSRDVMLGGWLHRHTCFVASKTMRGDRRRRERERQAVEMNSLEDHSAANLALVAPILDDAINQLSAEDRAAILLRYFEQRDLRSVGEELGSNEDAARKRVDRALDKLELLLKRRGVAFSATALAATLATQAVTAAPVGLAVSISTVALAGTAAGTGTTLTILKIMSMTKLKVAIISAVVVAGVTIPLVMHHQSQTKLREANESMQKQTEQSRLLAEENERLSNRLAQATAPKPTAADQARELQRLKGEVSKLRVQTADIAASKTNGPSPLSGMRANPAMWKLIRDQQKMGMSMIYQNLTNRVALTTNQVEKLNDTLADYVMDNIDQVTAALHDGKSSAQIDEIFAAQEAALLEKVRELLGPEALADYQDYTRNIASHLTAEQFKGKLTGDKAAKEEKAKQLYQVLQEETQSVLTSAGLAADFQLVPTMNFRNFASESESERNIKLLDQVYEQAAARAGSFLSADEIAKFGEFRTNALNVNRMSLAMNRQMMSPGSK